MLVLHKFTRYQNKTTQVEIYSSVDQANFVSLTDCSYGFHQGKRTTWPNERQPRI